MEVLPRFEKSVAKLQKEQRDQVKVRTKLLFDNPAHPSLKAHSIKPDKYYHEAYVNTGDRIIYIPEGSHLVLVDVVPHDDIGRYGKRPRQG
jgi:mRNA-degrading endonuclease YafQ of YafQ-DinJ toxin-antitoxin module